MPFMPASYSNRANVWSGYIFFVWRLSSSYSKVRVMFLLDGSAKSVKVSDGIYCGGGCIFYGFGYRFWQGYIIIGIGLFTVVRIKDADYSSKDIIGICGLVAVLVFKGQGFAISVINVRILGYICRCL